MPSFESLKRVSGAPKTLGQVRRDNSNLIMEATWDGDPQSRIAYLYDYFHDSEPNLSYNLSSNHDVLKREVPIKFIVHSHNSDGNDQVSYHIQFKPSYSCDIDYYDEMFHRRYGAEFPIGLYIDIPDGKGIYRRWLIVEDGSRYDLSFDKYCVYPVNYQLMWVEEKNDCRMLRKMWSVERMRNSYNAGTYTDKIFTRVENQTVIWLPMNPISDKIAYDDRFIVSAPIECPLTWKVSKLENTLPFGINRLVLYQDPFDQNVDYVNLKTGEMFANYYSSTLPPKEHVLKQGYGEIISASKEIKVAGGYKTLRAAWFDKTGADVSDTVEEVQWNFMVDDVSVTDQVETMELSDTDGNPVKNFIKVKLPLDYNLVTKVLTVKATAVPLQTTATLNLEILSL